MFSFSQKYFSTLLYFGTILYALFFTTRFFGTNDDMLVMLFVNGVYTGEPSEYSIFQNIIIGQLLKTLYIYFPSINWYTFFFDLVQTISYTALFFLMHKLLSKKVFMFLFVLPMLYFILETYTYLQFTKVAFLSSIVGVLYFIFYLYHHKKRYLILSYLLLILGFMIRFKALYGAILLALPIGIYILITNKKYILNLRFFTISFFILSSFFLLQIYNQTYYNNTPQWKTFKALIDIRRIVYYDRSITKACFLENGKAYNITKNDVDTFYKWTNDDANIFSPELLNHIHTSCTTGLKLQYEKATNINSLTQFFHKLASFDFVFMFMLILYLVYLLSKIRRLFSILYFLYFMGVLFFIFTLIFDYRVISSLVLEFYLLLLLLTYFEKVRKYYLFNETTTYISISLFFAILYTVLYPKVIYKKTPISLEKELPILKDNYIIICKSRNFFNYLPINTDFKNLFTDRKFYYLGWNLSSPDNQKVLKKLKNFYELILYKPNVILYIDAHRLPIIKKYIYEHFNKEIEFLEIYPNYYKIQIPNNNIRLSL